MQTRLTAHSLAEKMTSDGHRVALLAGDMEVSTRAAVIDRFRQAKEKVIILVEMLLGTG